MSPLAWAALFAVFLIAHPLAAQYTGRVGQAKAEEPPLRAIAVLEWTGDEEKPKNARLIPLCILDQGKLQDAGIYLARPVPLALDGGTQYEIQKSGKISGLFELQRAGQQRGSWIGFGSWKTPTAPKPKMDLTEVARSTRIDDVQSDDKPVLHRKRHPEDEKDGSGQASSGKTASEARGGTSAAAEDADPDRPTLRRKAQSAPAPAASPDPDRPTLKKSPPMSAEPAIASTAIPNFIDPDRPRLRRGKADSESVALTPTLVGLPEDLRQAVAVSDAKSRPEHSWEFRWADPADELKLKVALEQIARVLLGLNPPPAQPTAPRTVKSTRKAIPVVSPDPTPLAGENFRVFELAYGEGATLVLTAHTEAPLPQQRFVTLVAQPDLYGNPRILFRAVTDGAHLDHRPALRLVDAVDAQADNRGLLLFELRGLTQRQFALYRVAQGQTEVVFVGGGNDFDSNDQP